MGRKSIVINLSAEEREYLETQTRGLAPVRNVRRQAHILKGRYKFVSLLQKLSYLGNSNRSKLIVLGVIILLEKSVLM